MGTFTAADWPVRPPSGPLRVFLRLRSVLECLASHLTALPAYRRPLFLIILLNKMPPASSTLQTRLGGMRGEGSALGAPLSHNTSPEVHTHMSLSLHINWTSNHTPILSRRLHGHLFEQHYYNFSCGAKTPFLYLLFNLSPLEVHFFPRGMTTAGGSGDEGKEGKNKEK